ncbi:hypothetical protein G9A89_019467 [Geosiphon pyriformis]|nr:hypothetical protein G9A89_019467 [Geosiphon pyriformis]
MPAPIIELEKEIIGHELITIVSLATDNTMATQKDKASGTMNYVSLVVNNCLMKEYGMTFLVEKKHVTLRANTQSSSTIG